MNVPQAKESLEKIIRHFKTLDLQTGNVGALDRDLMLGYIRTLYDAVLSEQQQPSKATPPPAAEPAKATVAAAFERPIAPKPVVKETPPPEPEHIVLFSPPPPPKPEPKPEPIVVATPPPPPKPEPKPEPIAVATPKQSPEPKTTGKVPAEVVALFDIKVSKELADRLTETPIADIKKALGVGDKLATISQLFGGTATAFDDAVREIHAATNFYEARDYLIDNFAVQYDWGNEEKHATAKAFVKLVRRKFL